MRKPIPPTAPATIPLAQQKTDFTAEGSPPPGKVGVDVPVSSPEADPSSSPALPGKGRSHATKVKRSVRQGTDQRSGLP